MSAHSESIEAGNTTIHHVEPVEEPIESTSGGNESLALFGAAMGGALLGMLLTLLVLAIINSGTLRFSRASDVANPVIQEEAFARVNESLGAVSANVDTVAGLVTTQQGDVAALNEVVNTLSADLSDQGLSLSELGDTIAEFDETRAQFDLFLSALSDAVNVAQSGDAAQPIDDGPAVNSSTESTTADETSIATTLDDISADVVTVASSEQVAANSIAVLLFSDSNADGLLSNTDQLLTGMNISLQDSSGETLASTETTDAGLIFENLEPGDYTVVVEGGQGLDMETVEVAATVDDGDDTGLLIYIPVAE